MAVHVLLGLLFGFFVVFSPKLVTTCDVTVQSHDVCAVVSHRPSPWRKLLWRLQSGRRKPFVHARGGFGLPGFAHQFLALRSGREILACSLRRFASSARRSPKEAVCFTRRRCMALSPHATGTKISKQLLGFKSVQRPFRTIFAGLLRRPQTAQTSVPFEKSA